MQLDTLMEAMTCDQVLKVFGLHKQHVICVVIFITIIIMFIILGKLAIA
jgi:hypothetical protein